MQQKQSSVPSLTSLSLKKHLHSPAFTKQLDTLIFRDGKCLLQQGFSASSNSLRVIKGFPGGLEGWVAHNCSQILIDAA